MKWRVFLILVVCLHFIGCSTLFKGTTQEVNFNSNPQKARVIVNGVEMGETPVALKLETKKNLHDRVSSRKL